MRWPSSERLEKPGTLLSHLLWSVLSPREIGLWWRYFLKQLFIQLWCCSVARSYPPLCNPMDCNMPGSSVLHYDLEFAQCPLSQWYYLTISSSVTPFSSCPQSFPPSGSFPVSRLFESSSQSIRAPAPVLPMNIQGWFPLVLTGLISLLSKGLSKVFSSTTVRKHQFFSPQPSLWSNSHICTWLLEKI